VCVAGGGGEGRERELSKSACHAIDGLADSSLSLPLSLSLSLFYSGKLELLLLLLLYSPIFDSSNNSSKILPFPRCQPLGWHHYKTFLLRSLGFH
jgi:hypothetical protein